MGSTTEGWLCMSENSFLCPLPLWISPDTQTQQHHHHKRGAQLPAEHAAASQLCRFWLPLWCSTSEDTITVKCTNLLQHNKTSGVFIVVFIPYICFTEWLKCPAAKSSASVHATVLFARERVIITSSVSTLSAFSYQKRKSFSSQSPRGLWQPLYP